MESPRLKVQAALMQVLTGAEESARDAALAQLLAALRPAQPARPAVGLDTLILQLQRRAKWRQHLIVACEDWLARHSLVTLLSDAGLLGSEGFSRSLARRVAERLLPALQVPGDGQSWLVHACREADAEHWPAAIETSRYCKLLALLDARSDPARWSAHLLEDWLQALERLGYRLAAMSLEPELTRVLPDDGHLARAFTALLEELRAYTYSWRAARLEGEAQTESGAHLLVFIEQCREGIHRLHRRTRERGASLALSYLLARIEQSLDRLDLLLDVLTPLAEADRHAPLARLIVSLLTSVSAEHRVGALIGDTTGLLARRMSDNASQHGEHYVARTRGEFRAVFHAALGAGFIIPLMALAKLLMAGWTLPQFVAGLLNGLNYAAGFVLIYLLGFTVATKQPAMTAATFADACEQAGSDVAGLAELVTRTLRTQFIAVVGNLSVAFSLAVLIGLVSHRYGALLLTPVEAEALLVQLSPVHGLALWYAAIAGVWLFVSGNIAALGDNYATYARLGERVRAHPRLQHFSSRTRDWLARMVDRHLGGVLGNACFGLLLGLTGAFGKFFGLPLDIRHIAFGAANLGYGLSASGAAIAPAPIAWAALGVLLIGVVNLSVSFALALWQGLRARGVRELPVRQLLATLGERFRSSPRAFFLPPA